MGLQYRARDWDRACGRCIGNLTDAVRRAVGIVLRGERIAKSENAREQFGKEMARLLAVPIFSYAISFKHPAYKHEREVRLVLMNDLETFGPLIEPPGTRYGQDTNLRRGIKATL
jgi:hypothetical protein